MGFQYPKSVRFRCLRCGICCGDTKAKDRHILLLRNEAEQIAKVTKKPISEFAHKVEGKTPYSYEMTKTAERGKCVFLRDSRCRIYSTRPLICRFYPFELKITKNQDHSFRHTDECPGIGKGSELREEHFRKLFQLAHGRARLERRLD